jgi:hypothetical protein
MSSHKKRERERSPRGRDDRYDDDDQSDDDRGRSKKHAEHSATDYKQLYKGVCVDARAHPHAPQI